MQNKFRKKLKGIYFSTTLRSRGANFVWLFNLQSKFLRKGILVKKEKKDFKLVVKQQIGGISTRHFVSERSATISYWKGLENRAVTVANSYFIDQLEFKKNDLIVDCGANVGDVALYFQLMKFPIRYVGFEPSKREFSCLKKNLNGFKNYAAHNVGLWNGKGFLDLYVSSSNSDSSFIEPKTFSHTELLEVNRLDVIIKSKIKLFKVEAEGCEPEVLEGAINLLSNIQYISVDVGFERGIKEENTFVEVNNFLYSHSFKLEKFISPSGRWTALFKNKKI